MTDKRMWGAAALMALAISLVPSAVAALGASDPSADRETVRQQKAAVAAELDTLRATDAQVQQAIADLNANVSGEEARLEDAQRALAQANAAVETAKAEQAATEQRIADLEASLRALAVDAYVHGGHVDELATLASPSIDTAVRRQALLELRSGQDTDVADQLRAAREDLAIKRRAAEQAASAAAAKQAEIADRVDQLKAARAQQQQFASDVDKRIEAGLAESAALESLDKELSDQIAAQQAAIAAANSSGGGVSGGSYTFGNVTVVSVRGIQVNEQIADQVEALLDAAEADGFSLSGGGYRDPSAQIALRKAHCGTSDYAIYDMPPSQCHPPTARPGQSMHEQGLAIDFTWNGSIISSRSSPAYDWLDAHAGSYGLYNLPSEPWHWSTNGN